MAYLISSIKTVVISFVINGNYTTLTFPCTSFVKQQQQHKQSLTTTNTLTSSSFVTSLLFHKNKQTNIRTHTHIHVDNWVEHLLQQQQQSVHYIYFVIILHFTSQYLWYFLIFCLNIYKILTIHMNFNNCCHKNYTFIKFNCWKC